MSKRRKRRKSSSIIAVLLLAFIILIAVFGLRPRELFATVPGPEGPYIELYGVKASDGIQIYDAYDSLFIGVGELKKVSEASPGDFIAKHVIDEEALDETGYFWLRPDAKNPVIFAGFHETTVFTTGINLEVRMRRPSIDELTRKGDPSGMGLLREIEWFSFDIVEKETSTEKQWKHYVCYLVPVDFVLEFNIRPNDKGSWGAFKLVDLWFVLDTNVWYNAFTEQQMEDLTNYEPPEGSQVTAYSYRGGFPIWAWVGGWDPFVISDDEGEEWKESELQDVWDELEEYLQLYPSMEGTEVSLYTEPEYKHIPLYSKDILQDKEALENRLGQEIPNLPDPRFATTVFFPISLVKFGALKRWGGWGPWYWEAYYYPTAYLRIRALYAVWGEWVYLWTSQEAEDWDYRWENRSGLIQIFRSLWDQFVSAITGWLSNPFNFFLIILIILVVILVVLAVFAPGVLAAVSAVGSRAAEAIKLKGRRKKKRRPG